MNIGGPVGGPDRGPDGGPTKVAPPRNGGASSSSKVKLTQLFNYCLLTSDLN